MPESISVLPCFRKDGIVYFQLRVLVGLSRRYTPLRISYSLVAGSARVAAARAVQAASQLDEYWYLLRCQDEDLSGAPMPHLCVGGPGQQASDSGGVDIDCMSLSDAVVTYLGLKGDGKGNTHQTAERA